jgi:hypothetical protein
MNIYLCNVPELSKDYEHTFSFASLSNQINFFNTKIQLTLPDSKIKIDAEREYIVVDKNIQDLKLCNYIMTFDSNNKVLFYFINNKIYKTESVSHLVIELDVMQTYMFNYEILESFVDRMHVDRWTSTGDLIINDVIEDIEIGNTVIVEKQPLYPLTNNYVISSTTPLGRLNNGVDGNGDYIINTPPITVDFTTDYSPEYGTSTVGEYVEWIEPEIGGVGYPEYPGEPTGPGEVVDPGEPEGPEEPEITYPNYIGNYSNNLINDYLVSLALTDTLGSRDGLLQYHNMKLLFEEGEVFNAFCNVGFQNLLDTPGLRRYRRGSIIKSKPGKKLFLSLKSNEYSGLRTIKIIASGRHDFVPSALLDNVVPVKYYGNWAIIEDSMGTTQNVAQAHRNRMLITFLSEDSPILDYNVGAQGYQITENDIEDDGLFYVGSVGIVPQNHASLVGDNFFFTISWSRRSTTTAYTYNNYKIINDFPMNKKIKGIKYGTGANGVKDVNFGNYPVKTVPMAIQDELDIIFMKSFVNTGITALFNLFSSLNPITNAARCYQVYEDINALGENPKIVSPLNGIVVYAGTSVIGQAFKKALAANETTLEPKYYPPFNSHNLVLIKVSNNCYLEFSNLGNINVSTGQPIKAGDIIGLANDNLGFETAQNDTKLIDNSNFTAAMKTELINSYQYNNFYCVFARFLINEDGIFEDYPVYDVGLGVSERIPFSGIIDVGVNNSSTIGISTPLWHAYTYNSEGGYRFDTSIISPAFPAIID